MDGKVIIAFVFDGCSVDGSGSATPDVDLDFLDSPAEPETAVATRSTTGLARHAAADAYAATLGADPALAAAVWQKATGDVRLAQLDGDGLWVIAAAAIANLDQLASATGLANQWAATAVASRCLAAVDPELAWAGTNLAILTLAAPLQAAVAEALDRHLTTWDRDRRANVLEFLQAHGDGRCVRPLEALLARHGHLLDDTQAYKARHIVQIIRRGRRK